MTVNAGRYKHMVRGSGTSSRVLRVAVAGDIYVGDALHQERSWGVSEK